jgi:hypothetical protein
MVGPLSQPVPVAVRQQAEVSALPRGVQA